MNNTDNPNREQRPFWRKKRYWFIATVIALGIGVFKFDAGVTRLFGSITGQSSIGISDSMEPYELVFRSTIGGPHAKSEQNVPRAEWMLNVPRAFLTDMTGVNGLVGPHSDFFAHLEVVYDPAAKTFTALALADKAKAQEYAINIGLENSRGLAPLIALNGTQRLPPDLDPEDICVRNDDISEYYAKFGKKERDEVCGKEWKRCVIHTHLDGWGIRLATPHALYEKPRQICDAMRDFLNRYTVKREKLF